MQIPNRFSMLFLFVFVGAFGVAGSATAQAPHPHPQASISNELIQAKLYLPNVENGYYRGTRFDWSGVIHSLTNEGHDYFGEWQKSDDPYLNDRITGPVDSFEVNTDIAADETFLRIGVGVCAKAEEGKHPFRVVDHGSWKVQQGVNWIEFTHEVTDPAGRGYRYVKRMTLTPSRPELVIDHTLTNTGRKDIVTDVYNHNFFVLDNLPTGPDFAVRFPFELTSDRDLKGYAKLQGKELVYQKEITAGDDVFAMLTGYGESETDNAFTIEHRVAKAGVRVSTDRPIKRLRFWSPRTTLCPEPFVHLHIPPNNSDRWSIRYAFYSLDK